jgi:hypothetical protein
MTPTSGLEIVQRHDRGERRVQQSCDAGLACSTPPRLDDYTCRDRQRGTFRIGDLEQGDPFGCPVPAR